MRISLKYLITEAILYKSNHENVTNILSKSILRYQIDCLILEALTYSEAAWFSSINSFEIEASFISIVGVLVVLSFRYLC